jgi:predicted DCC family thiol-disulfide oxidoreductase YuxK
LHSVVFYENGTTYERSDAVLRILRRLGGPWKIAAVGRVFPAKFRDSVYRLTAQNRYRLFGKRETCRIPTAEERELFLD